MDLNKLPTDTAIEVLKWCKKNGVQWGQVGELLNLLKKKKVEDHEGQTKKRADSTREAAYNYAKIRKEKGLTMQTVQEQVPIQFKTLHNIEKTGKARPETLKRLNRYYGLE